MTDADDTVVLMGLDFGSSPGLRLEDPAIALCIAQILTK